MRKLLAEQQKTGHTETTQLDEHGLPTASVENLYRIFTVSESSSSTLGLIDKEITENLAGFLKDRIAAKEKSLDIIEQDFSTTEIPEMPQFVSEYTDYVMEKLVAHSVHISSPSFVGHMATPVPYFMLPLSRIMLALNQNLVKIETSKAFTPLERQVLGMVHDLVYEQDQAFYKENLHNSRHALGAFCSGGTIANITALWVARNKVFSDIGQQGFATALAKSGYQGAVVLVSKRGHYSLGKAVDILGIGRQNLISIDTDDNHRINISDLRRKCVELKAKNICIVSIVGIAGTTETGSVDRLTEMADIAEEFDTHFHVDAAWGGPTLLSSTYKHLLKGIERADSVTIDAHKQLYVPMGAGMVVFKDPETMNIVEHHAEYILRTGSKDLGQYSMEGSRSGMAMLVHAAFHIIGRKGYELLIDQNIEKTKSFVKLIEAHPDFELLNQPELNILNYRYVPAGIQQQLSIANKNERQATNEVLDQVTLGIQKTQRESGRTFVSRTRYQQKKYDNQAVSTFRVILANPMTTVDILAAILQEQIELAQRPECQALLAQLNT